MKKVFFLNNDTPIVVSFVVNNGVLVANYNIQIRSVKENKVLFITKGSNVNGNKDHILDLPVTVFDNSVLMAVIDIKGIDISLSNKYELGIEIKQGNNKLGDQIVSGVLTEDIQNHQIFNELQMS